MNSILTIAFISAFFQPSSLIDYNAAKYAIVNMSSPVTDHPISHATDLDLNTYFQTDYISSSAWIIFDFLGYLNKDVYVKYVILWLTDTFTPNLYIFKKNEFNIYFGNDAFCDGHQIRNKILNCSFIKDSHPTWVRYLLILHHEIQYSLQISELAIVIDTEDFVLSTLINKANQSNVYNNQQASYAIDYNPSTCIYTAVASESERNKPGWWMVDMIRHYKIYAVEINDIAAEISYRGDYGIYISSSDPFENNNIQINNNDLCITFKNASNNNNILKHYCNRTILGRYLAVVRNSEYRQDSLNFCEIKIFSYFDILQLPNFSKPNPSTTQSTINLSYPTVSTSIMSTINQTFLTSSNYCDTQKCEKDKLVIGIVVGILSILFGLSLGLIIGYKIFKKRKNRNQEKAVEYETMRKPEVHIYNELAVTKDAIQESE